MYRLGVWNDRGAGRPGQESVGGDDGGYRESRRGQGGGDEGPQISRSMFGSAQVRGDSARHKQNVGKQNRGVLWYAALQSFLAVLVQPQGDERRGGDRDGGGGGFDGRGGRNGDYRPQCTKEDEDRFFGGGGSAGLLSNLRSACVC